MSMPRDETITCKGCGSQQPFTLWESLNVTLNPECKQELIEGKLTRFVCEKCGWDSEIVYSLLYHDMTRPVMIWLVPSEEQPDTSHLPHGGLMKDYRFRLVRTRQELVEKILIFDAGLDDRTIELLKLTLKLGHKQDRQSLTGDLFFSCAGLSEAGDKVIQIQHITDDGSTFQMVPMDLLDELRDEFASELPSAESENGRWLRIDARYAMGFLFGK